MAEIEVRGLRELQGAFRKVDADLPKELRVKFKAVAEDIAGKVRGKVARRSGEAADSIKARATQRGFGIAFPAGGKPWEGVKAGYYPWLDFGGTTGRGRSISRPIIPGGRYIYPTIAEAGPEIIQRTDDAIEQVAERHNFETRGGL